MSKRKHHRPEFKAKVALANLKGVSRRLTGFGAETAYSPPHKGEENSERTPSQIIPEIRRRLPIDHVYEQKAAGLARAFDLEG